jgi:hypothetical protein
MGYLMGITIVDEQNASLYPCPVMFRKSLRGAVPRDL